MSTIRGPGDPDWAGFLPGDKVVNTRTGQAGTIRVADRVGDETVSVTGADGRPTEWTRADTIWAPGAFLANPGPASRS